MRDVLRLCCDSPRYRYAAAGFSFILAAASILARDGFLRGMKKLNELCQCELPRGAGPQVKIIGSQLVARQGRDILKSCAKLHFKTASEI